MQPQNNVHFGMNLCVYKEVRRGLQRPKDSRLMEIYIIDIWLEKIRRGWKIEDVPNEEIREALREIIPDRLT